MICLLVTITFTCVLFFYEPLPFLSSESKNGPASRSFQISKCKAVCTCRVWVFDQLSADSSIFSSNPSWLLESGYVKHRKSKALQSRAQSEAQPTSGVSIFWRPSLPLPWSAHLEYSLFSAQESKTPELIWWVHPHLSWTESKAAHTAAKIESRYPVYTVDWEADIFPRGKRDSCKHRARVTWLMKNQRKQDRVCEKEKRQWNDS